MTDFLAIIDGTGAFSDRAYDLDMMNSFCSQLSTGFAGKAHYQRGPSVEGALVETKGHVAAQFLAQHAGAGNRLFLAGYSRGGASALLAADKLQKKGIEVDGLILFDPVAKYVGPGIKKMPENVKNSVIFVRSLTLDFIKAHENKFVQVIDAYLDVAAVIYGPAFVAKAMGAKGMPKWLGNPLRPGWGEYFKGLTNSCSYNHQYFAIKASHGALGGVGWEEVKEDVKGQQLVVKHTNAVLRQWKINKAIKVLPNNACFPTTRKTLDNVNAKSKIKDVHRSFRLTPKGV